MTSYNKLGFFPPCLCARSFRGTPCCVDMDKYDVVNVNHVIGNADDEDNDDDDNHDDDGCQHSNPLKKCNLSFLIAVVLFI